MKPETKSQEPAAVKIYVPQSNSHIYPVRQQTDFLDHAPVRIYQKPPKKNTLLTQEPSVFL